MKKLYSLFISLFFILICGAEVIYGMELDYEKYIQAKEHNACICPLIKLCDEKLLDIFSYCYARDNNQGNEFKNRIESFVTISMTCKKFNELLSSEEMSRPYKKYTLTYKNTLVRNLIDSWDTVKVSCPLLQEPIETSYSRKNKNRISTLVTVLIYAGADANIQRWGMRSYGKPLLQMAVDENNAHFVEILLKYGANPNINFESPAVSIFHVKSKAIAELFVKHGVNIHENKYSKTNVFWYVVNNNDYSSDLIEFYLDHNANVRILDENNTTLLHELAGAAPKKNIDNFLKKAQLLIAAIPDMINALNIRNKTPLDVAQVFLEVAKKRDCEKTIEALEKLIALYRKHGGLTAQELTTQKIVTCQ